MCRNIRTLHNFEPHATTAEVEAARATEQIQVAGGYEAVQLRVAEQYIQRFGELAKAGNTLVLPANLADVGSMLALAMNVIGRRPAGEPPAGFTPAPPVPPRGGPGLGSPAPSR